MPLDLLVFGPHPDDIEIGMGATVALHARRGDRVGLVDLTRGELGSNGTPDERVAEAAEASAVLGAVLRLNLALPDGCLSVDDEGAGRRGRPLRARPPAARHRHPALGGSPSRITAAPAGCCARRSSAPACGASSPPTSRGARSGSATTSSTTRRRRRSSSTSARSTRSSGRRSPVTATQFTPAGDAAAATRLTSPLFAQLIESRDAQFGALAGVRYAEGFVVREPVARPHLFKAWPAGPAEAPHA